MKKYQLLRIMMFGLPYMCLARPEDLDKYYKTWKPLTLVRGLRELGIDPFDVFRALEAVKGLNSDEALDVMHELDMRPITIYDALDDLGIDPHEAYYALKSWLTDPLLHQPGDHYHRVNVSGDPTHPYLHLVYKKVDSDESWVDSYKACYLTSSEIEKELEALEKEYKNADAGEQFRMNDFIKKAKEIHSAFDDPSKVFKDFFGDRHFEEWKKAFPQAFKGLSEIYKNPLGTSFKKTRLPLNETLKQDTIYHHVHKGKGHGDRKQQEWDEKVKVWVSEGPKFAKSIDPNRYDNIMDDSHTEKGEDGSTIIRFMRVYYDRIKDQYMEMNETQTFTQSDFGTVRKVKSNSMTFDPKTYTALVKDRYQQEISRDKKEQQLPTTQPPTQPPTPPPTLPPTPPPQQKQQQPPPHQQQQQQQQPYQPHPGPYQYPHPQPPQQPYYPHPLHQQPHHTHPGPQQSPQAHQHQPQQQSQQQPQQQSQQQPQQQHQQHQQPWQWSYQQPPQQWYYHPNQQYYQQPYPPQYPHPQQPQGNYYYPPQPQYNQQQQPPHQQPSQNPPSQHQKAT